MEDYYRAIERRHVLDVESTTIISTGGVLVVPLHRLHLSGELVGGESDDYARIDDSSNNTTHWDCSDSYNFVHNLIVVHVHWTWTTIIHINFLIYILARACLHNSTCF